MIRHPWLVLAYLVGWSTPVPSTCPGARCPAAAGEGTVLRIDGAAGGSPDWSRAVMDDAERERRLDRARDTLRRLGDSDPGGDVIL